MRYGCTPQFREGKTPLKIAIFGKKTLILALYDPFQKSLVDFPLKGGWGYPQFPLTVFWKNDFPSRG